MKLKSILSSVAALAGGPGISAAIQLAVSAVNAFKGPEEQLPVNATQDQVISAYGALPAADKVMIDAKLNHELGLEKEATKKLEILNKSDGVGKSTRPWIAKWAFIVMSIISLTFTAFLFTLEGEDLKTISDMWPLLTAVMGPFVVIVHKYFDARTHEKRTRYAVAHDQSANVSALGGLLNAVMKR